MYKSCQLLLLLCWIYSSYGIIPEQGSNITGTQSFRYEQQFSRTPYYCLAHCVPSSASRHFCAIWSYLSAVERARGKMLKLKGPWHEIFGLWFFSANSKPYSKFYQGPSKLFEEKNRRSKISCQGPFKTSVPGTLSILTK
jgi:hypothetical protein